MDKAQYKIFRYFLVCGFLVLSACNAQEANEADVEFSKQPAMNVHPYDVNKYQINKLVCDPMGEQGNPGANDGLIAELFYLNDSHPRYKNVQEYIDNGVASSQKLFFTDLNVPTRLFDTGFPTEAGNMIQDDSGNDLIEYFALRFKSTLKLSPDDEEGDYELALLSDDGTVMKIIDVDGVAQVVVDNDHNHPTKMGCGDIVHFDHDTSYDVVIDYYQGPRYHISIIPMWRKVGSQTQAEKECGQKGNSRYFDFNNNSAPKDNYLDMLLRGWKPIAAENWNLPPMAIFNPCQQGTNPLISNFSVRDINEGVAIITWETDIPATSQVILRDENGVDILITQSDNILRTSHQIVLQDEIQFGMTYQFQAVSISADMGKTLSRVLQESF